MSLGIGKTVNVDGQMRDVWIEFEIESYYPGTRGDYYNPPESDEYEFRLISIRFDMTDEEVPEIIRSEIEEWFDSLSGYSRLYEVAAADGLDW
jgi:hypothetical protein